MNMKSSDRHCSCRRHFCYHYWVANIITSMIAPLLEDRDFRYEDTHEDVDILLRGYVDSESPPSYLLLSSYLENESQNDSSPNEEIGSTRQHGRQKYIKGQVQSLIGSLLSFKSSSSSTSSNDSIKAMAAKAPAL